MSIQFAYAQLSKAKYIVFTFEYSNNESPHGTQIYYWIQSVDSIGRQHSHLNKLLLSGYSESELQSCCIGKSINPYTSTSVNSYNFNQKYYMALDTVERIIKKYRKRIRVEYKDHEKKAGETINIYITPIEGIFCVSGFIPLRDREMLYKDSIIIPYSSFCFYRRFWESEEYKYVVKHDYTRFLYSILPPNIVK